MSRKRGWSDSWIIQALGTRPSMVYRVRKQLVEEGFEAVLSRKPRATPAIPLIFDGEKEAKLIALACSKPPKGRARWTLRLLENKVALFEAFRECASDSIGFYPGPIPMANPHDIVLAGERSPYAASRRHYGRSLYYSKKFRPQNRHQ